MDFFARQAAARRQTRWLLAAFLLAVAIVIGAIDWVMLAVTSIPSGRGPMQFAAENPGSALTGALVVLIVIGVASLYRTVSLRDGGGVVARSLGGVRVDRDATDPARRRLHNVVEEMAIASGVPMPEVYVLEHETAINAFAAGLTPANAAIAVTRGAVDRLDRAEMQGVIAHEFSHILNGDMRLNLRLMGWLFGLLVLSIVGRIVLQNTRRARGRSAGVVFVVALALFVFGWIGLALGRIIQAAVSRHRERLADASAVQFTRNPLGLRGALVKIAGSAGGSRLASADTEEVAHMLFASGSNRLLATHPPLTERILALDPSFDVTRIPREGDGAAPLAGLPGDSGDAVASLSIAAVPVDAARIVAQIGRPVTVHVRQARDLRIALPATLRTSAETPTNAAGVMLALLASRSEPVRRWQLARIAEVAGVDLRARVGEAMPVTDSLAPMLRLPAVLLAYPSLRRLAPGERGRLIVLIDDLSRADARIDAFEFCLAKLVSGALRDDAESRPPHGNATLDRAAASIATLFAVLAVHGHDDERLAREAYELGLQRVLPREHLPCELPPDWPKRLDAALDELATLQPFAKQALIEGLAVTAAHDGKLAVSEAELLRTVCAILRCPLPPILPEARVE